MDFINYNTFKRFQELSERIGIEISMSEEISSSILNFLEGLIDKIEKLEEKLNA